MRMRCQKPKPLIDPVLIDFYIQNGFNVLMCGRHGVGKTALIVDGFKRAGLRLRYFSGSTMDPWVDLVGVPKERIENGRSYLDLIRPREFEDDAVDAVFIDEFNRAPKKVRNAAMELLQFQSVNGRKFASLQMVWAAVNPDDEDSPYDVERLDPAQLDRFHVTLQVPYRPCPAYFSETYDTMGKAALEWWDSLAEKAKDAVTPRRLEYALQMHIAGGALSDVLPECSNPRRLASMLDDGPLFDRLRALIRNGDREGAKELLSDPNDGPMALKQIIRSRSATVFFLPLVDAERLMSLLANPVVLESVVRYAGHIPEFREAAELLAAGGGPLASRAAELARKFGVEMPLLGGQPTLIRHTCPLSEEQISELDPYGRIVP